MNGETESYIEPTEISMGRNRKGEDCIVMATLPGGHQVDWNREVYPAPMPKGSRGKSDVAAARAWATQMTAWAHSLAEAADWADAHTHELNGIDGA